MSSIHKRVSAYHTSLRQWKTIYIVRKIVLERVCSQTQLCQLRCLMTVLDNYMFRPLLAIFRLSLRELEVLLKDNLKMASNGRNM